MPAKRALPSIFIFPSYIFRTEDFLLPLSDGNNEDLIKKNKKRKSLGSIRLKVTLSPITKEEMNEVCLIDGQNFCKLFQGCILLGYAMCSD